MSDKPIHAKPSLYTFFYETAKQIGLEYGYNIIVHGSMNRDLDLIAIPWEEEVKNVPEMIDKIAECFGGFVMQDTNREKPHGRTVYVININRTIKSKFDGMATQIEHHHDPQYYIDISVIPIK